MSMMIRRHKQQRENVETKPVAEVEKTLSEASATDTRPLTYTKNDIMRMRKVNLVELAKSNGIDGADDMSGNQIKAELVKVLGL